MPTLHTELTEIVTGLGMLGIKSLDEALKARPSEMLNVSDSNFDRLEKARTDGQHRWLFDSAWKNGRAFLRSGDGLRGRRPRLVEWKGSHKPPVYEQVPADLRVDYVYLVSCKYRSKILHNASPVRLFDRLLATPLGHQINWYSEVAPKEFQNLYEACLNHCGIRDFPQSVNDLSPQNRKRLKKEFERKWPPGIVKPYRSFCNAVSRVSTDRWQKALDQHRILREETLWRLLRIQSAPYFILGMTSSKCPVRFRVETPWDLRQRYTFRSFEPEADTGAGQPTVRWRADLADRLSGAPVHVEGHVEVRWSHGRFSGAPEAKVYLDTGIDKTPGYSPLR